MLFWSSLRSALGSAALHPLTAALLLIAFCLILWWLYKLFTHRLSTLAGVITIQGEPLPLFDIEAQAVGTTPRLWRLQQACERGTFALYDVPAGPLKLDFSFGTAASCKCTATVTVTKGRNLLDLDLSLELDRLDVQRTITSGVASETDWQSAGDNSRYDFIETTIFHLAYLQGCARRCAKWKYSGRRLVHAHSAGGVGCECANRKLFFCGRSGELVG
jgi:hypothetical protein